MNLNVSQMQGRVPVTVMDLHGDVDGSNYTDLIARGQEIAKSGARNILLDLSDVRYMSSAGLLALHSIAMMARGQQPPDPESGWEAFRAMSRDQSGGDQKNVKLLNPQARVRKVLETAGFDRFFEIHTDLTTAVASF
jgi:anti-anti-sigma regulatory factor